MGYDSHSRSLRHGRWLQPGIIFAVTTCVRGRRPALRGDAGRIVLDALLHLRQLGRARVFGFVIMPDHVHAIVQPLGDQVVTDVVKSWKAFSARRLNAVLGLSGPLWQTGYFDHAVRGDRDFLETLQYIHHNPVRAGLARSPEQHLLSSAHPLWSGEVDRVGGLTEKG